MKVKSKPTVHDHVLDEFDHQGLMPGKTYEVIGISCDYYRILDEMGEPILYPKHLFEIVDATLPETWIRSEYGQDEYYADPPVLGKPGFYERYFDGEPKAKAVFEAFLQELHGAATHRGGVSTPLPQAEGEGDSGSEITTAARQRSVRNVKRLRS